MKFILDDQNYRQSASGCKMEIKFEKDKDFLILAECLIDHNRVMLRVKQRPINSEFEKIAKKIEDNYNSKILTELKEL